ncbi:MAG: hypothetical protein Q9212_001836 [Teloschistes hypoglaucus]
MEDLIACLYPYQKNEPAQEVVVSHENSARHIEARKKRPELPGRGSRETTAPPDDNTNNIQTQKKTPAWHFEEGLQLTFSHGPKAGLGFVLGTNASSCDIVLPPLRDENGKPVISRKHCYITFDAQRRLIVRDCSSQGTIVEYNGDGGEKRRNFTWIIGGHQVPDSIEEIVLQIHNDLKFQIVVSKPTFPDLFFDNVDEFCVEIAENDELPFGALGLQSGISTAGASGAQTPEQRDGTNIPNQNSILLKRKKLGKGAFSVVHHVWDVSTGSDYASKKFRYPKKVNWKREASIMKKISHAHTTRLMAAIEEPSPQLILEYLPLGNLEDQDRQRNISDDETVITLHQSLLALTYLHGQTPSIVHRDIKPQNILVQSRDPFHIKLADFGLSKASDYLVTLCGTHTYLSPEIARHYGSNRPECVKYANAVDIWSLGVVIFEYAYGLPHPGSGIGLPWCEKIISALDDLDTDKLTDLLSTMIVMDPNLRAPARQCLPRALQLRVPGRCQTPTPASCSLRQGQAEDDYGSPTIILGNMWGTQGTSYQDNSKISPVRIKRQRSPAVGSTSSSTTGGRNKRRHHDRLFKQGSDGRIVDADALLGDDITEVETAAGIGIEFKRQPCLKCPHDLNQGPSGQWGDRQASFRKFYERSIDTGQEVRIK